MANDDDSQNPKPRIGRKDKSYEFSKSFDKKYGKRREKIAEQKRERERERSAKTIEQAFASGIVGSNVVSDPIFVPALDKVAILCNQYGIDGAAEILNIDVEQLDYFLRQGADITRRDEAILTSAFETAIVEYDDIDFEEIEQYAENLKWTTRFIGTQYVGTEHQDTFRYAVAQGNVNVEENLSNDGDITGYSLFAQGLDAGHRKRINDFIAEGNDTSEMFEAYKTDMEEKGSIFFPVGDERYNESYWWAWFRETFYA